MTIFKTLITISLSILFLFNIVCAQDLIIIDNKVSGSIQDPPALPTRDSCKQYSIEIEKQISRINTAHDECLNNSNDDNGTSSQSNYSTDVKKHDRCTKYSCQTLHSARTEIRRQLSENMNICNKNASLREKMLEPVIGSRKRDGNVNTSKLSTELDQGEKVARNAISKLTSKTSRLGALTALDVKKLRDECEKVSGLQGQKICLARVHSYARDMRHQVGSGPIVEKIQDTANDELQKRQNETIDRMDDISNQIENVDESTEKNSKRKRVRERREPIIENE